MDPKNADAAAAIQKGPVRKQFTSGLRITLHIYESIVSTVVNKTVDRTAVARIPCPILLVKVCLPRADDFTNGAAKSILFVSVWELSSKKSKRVVSRSDSDPDPDGDPPGDASPSECCSPDEK
jgi:hypothetical protein